MRRESSLVSYKEIQMDYSEKTMWVIFPTQSRLFVLLEETIMKIFTKFFWLINFILPRTISIHMGVVSTVSLLYRRVYWMIKWAWKWIRSIAIAYPITRSQISWRSVVDCTVSSWSPDTLSILQSYVCFQIHTWPSYFLHPNPEQSLLQ